MTEEETKDVTDQTVVEPEVKTEDQSQEQEAQKSQEKSKEYNFARMREKQESLEQEVKELRQKQEPQPQKEVDELAGLSDDDILTVAQTKKLAARQAEEIVKRLMKERENASLPEKTRSKYEDFDAILNEENIKKLEKQEPGLADACSKASNPWEATYKVLKKFIVPAKEEKAVKGEKELNDNLALPTPSIAAGNTRPLNNANIWAKASKEELYKQMTEAAKRL